MRGACVRNLGDYGELGVHVIPHIGDVCRETSGTVDGREPDTRMHERRVERLKLGCIWSSATVGSAVRRWTN
jgi:hypothetical protein